MTLWDNKYLSPRGKGREGGENPRAPFRFTSSLRLQLPCLPTFWLEERRGEMKKEGHRYSYLCLLTNVRLNLARCCERALICRKLANPGVVDISQCRRRCEIKTFAFEKT